MKRQQTNRNHWLHRWSKWTIKHRLVSLCILALVTASLCILNTPVLATLPTPHLPTSPPPHTLIAQSPSLLDQGRSLYQSGRFEEARTAWEKAENEYRRQGDRANLLRSRLYQAQALKALGAYVRTLEILQELDKTVPSEPPSSEKAQILRSLGEVYQAIGGSDNLKKARVSLQQSLEIAQTPDDKSASYLSLGMVDRTEISRISPQTFVINSPAERDSKIRSVLDLQSRIKTAAEIFQTAITSSTSSATTLSAELTQLSLLVNVVPKFNGFLSNALNDLQAELATPYNTPYFLKHYLSNSARLPHSVSTPSADLKEPDQRIIDLATLTRQTAELIGELPQFLAQIRPTLVSAGGDRIEINARINFAQSLIGLPQVAASAENVNRQLKAILETIQKPSQKPSSTNQKPKKLAKISANLSLFLPERTRLELQTAISSSFPDAAKALKQAADDARNSNNKRAEASALTALAELYGRWAEFDQQPQRWWTDVETIAQRGLILAQDSNAPEIAYRLQWQLVQALRNQKGNAKQVRSACQGAVKTLQALRTDLVNTNQDVQFTFRDNVEPFYRDCVAALLSSDNASQQPTQDELEEARQLIESLQLAELDNFFREACIEGRKVAIDQLVDQDNPTTAVIYPIILSQQQLGVIAKIPGQKELDYHPVNLPERTNLEKVLTQLRQQLTDDPEASLTRQNTSQVYDWLIRPFVTALKANKVDTLVFVLDGPFRNLPMAALYNQESGKYLVDDYAIAVSPGLQLLTSKSLNQQQPNVLAAGIMKDEIFQKYGLAPLKGFKSERESINQAGFTIQSALVDEAFNSEKLATELSTVPSNIVHLSTHGKFSSRKEDTYIFMGNGKIPVDELGKIFQQRRTKGDAIELLVLSACETATGDNRATLGLAGVALKTGVRSTLASLWTIPDAPTATFMDSFYKALKEGKSKAQAVQAAQLAIKQTSDLSVWAAYVLVGNWS